MSAWAMLTAAAVLGVDVGWQPLDGGGFEYIIQIPPHQVQSLLEGQDITSDVPPLLRGVRTYRVTVGTQTLPQLGAPPLPVSQQPAAVQTDPPDDPPAVTDATPPPELPETLDPEEIAQANHITQAQPHDHATGYASQPGADHHAAPPDGSPHAGQDDHEGHALQGDGAEETPSVADAWPDQPDMATQPAKQWWPLTLSLMGLFGSVGLNGYLGWIFFELRSRHRQLVVRQIQDAAFDAP